MWTNYHTHSTFCDGKKSIAEVVATAVSLGMPAIGLSSHAPLPFTRPWCMKNERLAEYIAEIAYQKRTAKDIEVYAGLEVDYIPGKISPTDFAKQLDYTIGSIHFVDRLPNGEGWEIDGTRQLYDDGVTAIFGGDARAAVTRYFELTREMIAKGRLDIVGHLDKIKMHNSGEFSYAEDSLWYVGEVRRTLDVIQDAGSIIEVNTRGIYQKKTTTTYPSPWVLAEMNSRGIPVTLSSDAHHPDDLVNQFPLAAEELLKAGFKKIRILLDGKWKDVSFNERGIITSSSHHSMAQ